MRRDAPSLPVLLAVAACVRAPAPPTPPVVNAARTSHDRSEDAAVSDDASEPHDAAPPCDSTAHPTLTDYTDVREGAPLSLLVRREPSGAWVPVNALRMPLHHASSLVFEPPLDSLVRDDDRGGPVLVLAVGLGRRAINFDERRHVWFATYAARVSRVCPSR